jgi:hypothetical protein
MHRSAASRRALQPLELDVIAGADRARRAAAPAMRCRRTEELLPRAVLDGREHANDTASRSAATSPGAEAARRKLNSSRGLHIRAAHAHRYGSLLSAGESAERRADGEQVAAPDVRDVSARTRVGVVRQNGRARGSGVFGSRRVRVWRRTRDTGSGEGRRRRESCNQTPHRFSPHMSTWAAVAAPTARRILRAQAARRSPGRPRSRTSRACTTRTPIRNRRRRRLGLGTSDARPHPRDAEPSSAQYLSPNSTPAVPHVRECRRRQRELGQRRRPLVDEPLQPAARRPLEPVRVGGMKASPLRRLWSVPNR